MRKIAISIAVTALSLGVGAASVARADVFSEMSGPRSFAMGGAHRALGSSNETLWLNPAGMAVAKRYHIELQYLYDTDDRISHANGSVVDSKTGPVAGGLALTRDWGNESGANPALYRFYLGSAYAIGGRMALGLTTSYVKGDYRYLGNKRDINAVNVTAGSLLMIGDQVGIAAVYQNILRNNPDMQIPTLGFGLGVRSSVFSIDGDVSLDMRDAVNQRVSYHAGAEVFLFETVALRAGYRFAAAESVTNALHMHFLSGGIGVVGSGGAFTAGIRRALTQGEAHWGFTGSFQFFL